ncbi:laccase [Crucibulum laeve]|uniref:laccase n=1 Tax=Crucibulum laeve TaxID=68775 RepID=A0A5C3LNH1_9AGAR|nr:laccase [Crucibulum laeve]
MQLLFYVLVFPFIISISNAALGPSDSLEISNKIIAPDGYERSSVLVNGVYPSPLIQARKGARFHMKVINSLTDDTMQRGTSIHWHGIIQRGTGWADGPVGVNQCPIAPNHTFVYDFPSYHQAGTFWYHSHFGTQYCDGLRGPLVIYDPNDPHKDLYDKSTIITLGEWYHTPSPSVVGIAVADTTLINGKGRFPGGPEVGLAIIGVEQGKRYRMRLVSISCDSNYVFSIDGHEFTVIEADGENTLPLLADNVQIFSGQRYSLVLHANQPIDNYWIRSLPNSGHRGISTTFSGGVNSAILRYKGAPIADPNSISTPTKPLSEADLHPLDNPATPGDPNPEGADVRINLALSIANFTFFINGKSFVPPTIPVLLQILSGARDAQDLMPQGSIITLPRNKVIELTVPGGVPGGPHPFHLHGHAFSVIRSAGNDTQPNYASPVRRDVVNIGNAGSNVTIRFRTDNPGPWIFHCHIDFHLKEGLAIVFAEDPAGAAARIHPPDAWDELCPIYDGLAPAQTSVQIVPPAPTA